jgi:membrane protease YdiL (CAAX protease family)
MLKRIAQLEPAPPWGFFGAINTAFIPLVALVAASLVALSLVAEPIYLANVLTWVIAAALTLLYIRVTRRTPQEVEALRLGMRSRLLINLLWGIGLAILIDIIALGITGDFLPQPELAGLWANRESAGLIAWVLIVVFALVLQPISEELVFRGVFFSSARASIGGWGGLFVTAMVYALYHYLAFPFAVDGLTGVWYRLVSPLLAGLILGGIRANSGSTLAAIVAHVGFNLFALLKLLVLL